MNTQSWTKYADVRIREEVHDALESLPESERTILTLYYMAGMTSEEIGRFIGTSCGAIRDRLYRARLRLKEELTMIEETLGGFQLPPTLTTRDYASNPRQLHVELCTDNEQTTCAVDCCSFVGCGRAAYRLGN